MKTINPSKITTMSTIETRFAYDPENIDRNIWRQLDVSMYETLPQSRSKNIFNFYILERYKKETDKFQIVLSSYSAPNDKLPISASEFYPINSDLEYNRLSLEKEIVLFEESRSIHLERLCRIPHLNEIWNIIDSLPWDNVILNKFLETFEFLDEKSTLRIISELKNRLGMFFKTQYHSNLDKRCVWEIIQYCGLEYANKYLKFVEKGE